MVMYRSIVDALSDVPNVSIHIIPHDATYH